MVSRSQQRLSRRLITSILLALCLIFGPIPVSFAQSRVSDNGFALGRIVLQTQQGDTLSLVVEIAATRAERARGLMWREELRDSEGMLFVWPDRAVRQFWMKNTPLSLDILFFNEAGILSHIAESQEPYSTELISSLVPTKYVLELPAGGVRRRSIALGDVLTIIGDEK